MPTGRKIYEVHVVVAFFSFTLLLSLVMMAAELCCFEPSGSGTIINGLVHHGELFRSHLHGLIFRSLYELFDLLFTAFPFR